MAEAQSVYFVGEGHILSYQEHDAILQTLDRASKGIFLGKDFFVKNLDAWNNVPLIYGPDHVEPSAYNADPSKELDRVKARLIDGHVSGASIELTGHPRLMATLNIDDAEVEEGIEAGMISISTAFLAQRDDKQLLGDVQPHHILFFLEEPGVQPGDKGAFILNTDDHDKTLRAKLLDMLGIKASKVEHSEPAVEPEKEKNDMAEKELEAKLAEEGKRAEANRLLFTDSEEKLSLIHI